MRHGFKLPVIISIILNLAAVSITGYAYAGVLDELAKTTVFLSKTEKEFSKNPASGANEPTLIERTGTGFSVLNNGKTFLVTAAHIAKMMSDDARLHWNIKAGGTPASFTFRELRENVRGAKWFYHPSADVAVHLINFPQEPELFILGEDFIVPENQRVSIGTKVYIFGYPFGFGKTTKSLSPLVKKAEIASSITEIDHPLLSPDEKFVILDEDLAQGFSGAPVFVSPEPQMSDKGLVLGGTLPQLIGIQSRTISDSTGGKISLVIPSFYLTEIFESEEFKLYEEEIRAAEQVMAN